MTDRCCRTCVHYDDPSGTGKHRCYGSPPTASAVGYPSFPAPAAYDRCPLWEPRNRPVNSDGTIPVVLSVGGDVVIGDGYGFDPDWSDRDLHMAWMGKSVLPDGRCLVFQVIQDVEADHEENPDG